MRGIEVSSPRTKDELLLSEDLSALAESSIIDDWNLVVVSNQPDISRGRINLNLVEYISEAILSQVPLNASFICPHIASENCECRKPKIGLIDRFKKDFPEIVGKMILVGDRDTDRECAKRAGMDFILRKRKYNISSLAHVDYSVENLHDLSPLLDRVSF
jgi:D-glycero-D-manno-heptose 1,7-bisphosphate phosphatase